jgi:hypothetical protein
MDSDLAVLYQKYVAYMADLRRAREAMRSERSWLPCPETLTSDQFDEMWRLAGQHPGLRDRWLRRLTHGYEQEKSEIARSLAEINAPRRAALQAKPPSYSAASGP